MRVWRVLWCGIFLLVMQMYFISRRFWSQEDSDRKLQHKLVSGLLRKRPNLTASAAAARLLGVARQRNSTLGVVQVGACDGEWWDSNDPVQALLTDTHVSALAVEPVPRLWQELRTRLEGLPQSRRILAVNAAVCAESSPSKPFYTVSERFAHDHPESPHWARRQLGSFQREHLRKHKIPNQYIDSIEVPCMTPLQLLAENGSPLGYPAIVDVLMIDAEGLDGQLVQAFLGVGVRPALLVFEQKHLPPAELRSVRDALTALGFVHARDVDQLVAIRPASTWWQGDPFMAGV